MHGSKLIRGSPLPTTGSLSIIFFQLYPDRTGRGARITGRRHTLLYTERSATVRVTPTCVDITQREGSQVYFRPFASFGGIQNLQSDLTNRPPFVGFWLRYLDRPRAPKHEVDLADQHKPPKEPVPYVNDGSCLRSRHLTKGSYASSHELTSSIPAHC